MLVVVVPLASSQEDLPDGNANNTNSTNPIEKFQIEDQTFVTPTAQTSRANITDIINATTWPNIHSNVLTDFDPKVFLPEIEESAFIHPFAVVIGDCHIGRIVLVAPTAVCRGDEGTPIKVGDLTVY